MPLRPASISSSFSVGLRALPCRSPAKFVRHLSHQATRRFPPTSCCFDSSIGLGRRAGLAAHLPSSGAFLRAQSRAISLFKPPSTEFELVRHYTDLPDEYEDAVGLPFREDDITQKECNAMFGPHLDAVRANRLLRILHGRRVAGTLEDPTLHPNTAHYRNKDKATALQYLRDNMPVNEVLNAGLRAEDELHYIEEQERAERERAAHEEEEKDSGQELKPLTEESGKEKQKSRPAAPQTRIAPTGRLPRKPKSDSPYGESNFDRIRARNVAKREAEEKLEEEARLKREEEEAMGNIGTLQTQQAKPREISPYMKKYTERATSTLEAPPEMTLGQRMAPILIMTLLICAGCLVFAATYKPPRQSWRLWPDIPPAAATCIGLIGLNLAVSMCWRVPPFWAFLNRYFLLVPATPRPFQVLGAMFSHQELGHLTLNMAALYVLGTLLHDEIGRGNFLALFFSAGAIGYLGSMTSFMFRPGGLAFTSSGASGAVYGIFGAYFWLHKFDEFKIMGLPPDPMSGPQGLAYLAVIVGYHLYLALKRNPSHGTDLVNHMVGMAAGIVGVELVKRRMDEQARLRAKRMKTMNIAMDKAVVKQDLKHLGGSPTEGR